MLTARQHDLSSPFNRPDADVILRSTDGVDFRVHKLILSISSPLFNGVLSCPQENTDSPNEEENLEVIWCADDAETLDIVLSFCYPIEDTVMTDIATLKKVVSAAEKYKLHTAVGSLEHVYLDLGRDEMKTHPVEVYALSRRFGWRTLEKAAIKASLHFSHNDIHEQFATCRCPPEGQEGVKLLRCHFKCTAATREFLNSTFKYPHHDVECAKKLLETNGPLAIVEHMETIVTRYITQGHWGSSGELINLPRILKSYLSDIMAQV